MKMTAREIFTVIFMSLGFVCFLISAIGVFRFKDFYARLHAAGICESAGLVLCSVGFLIYEGPSVTGIKIFTVFLAVFIASPIGNPHNHESSIQAERQGFSRHQGGSGGSGSEGKGFRRNKQ